jgi:hypothetical protein
MYLWLYKIICGLDPKIYLFLSFQPGAEYSWWVYLVPAMAGD